MAGVLYYVHIGGQNMKIFGLEIGSWSDLLSGFATLASLWFLYYQVKKSSDDTKKAITAQQKQVKEDKLFKLKEEVLSIAPDYRYFINVTENNLATYNNRIKKRDIKNIATYELWSIMREVQSNMTDFRYTKEEFDHKISDLKTKLDKVNILYSSSVINEKDLVYKDNITKMILSLTIMQVVISQFISITSIVNHFFEFDRDKENAIANFKVDNNVINESINTEGELFSFKDCNKLIDEVLR